MLRIIYGDACALKNERLINEICKAVQDEKKVYVLVPDQFSFEYDKKLYKTLGAKMFNSIPVLSFIKVSKQIIEQYGTIKGEYADDYTKQIFMYKSLKSLKSSDDCLFYKRQLDKPAFVSIALDTVKEFKQASVSPQCIFDATSTLSGSLSKKMLAVGTIYNEYNIRLSENEYKDSLSDIHQAAEIASLNNHFNGYSVFIDGFEGFTADETEMIKAMILSAENFNVALTIGDGSNSKTKISPFINSQATMDSIINIAKDYNKPIEYVKADTCTDKSLTINYISRNILSPSVASAKQSDGIKVIKAVDIYQECEYVCAQIKHLVCDSNYRYSDIAIVARQLSDYTNVLEGTAQRYDIPLFCDERQSVSQNALVLYINSMLECVITKKYNTENILRYIKSNLCLLGDAKISRIEDYCYEWGVNGNIWLSDFTAQKEKDKQLTFKDGKQSYLENINEIRTLIINPLEEFKALCNNTDVSHICRAFYNLLDKIKVNVAISKSVYSACQEYGEDNAEVLEISRNYKQLWQLINNIIKSINDVLGDENMSLKEFYELFSVLVSKSTISLPPQKLDAVILAGAERSRLPENIKVTFVVGVNDGVMPKTVTSDGLISDREKSLLSEAGINISKTSIWKIAQERFLVYQALCSPSDELYVSYSESDLAGNIRRPSVVIKQLISMFSDKILISASELSPLFYCMTKDSAYYKYLENIKDYTKETASIKYVLSREKEYAQKIDSILKTSENPVHSLEKNKSTLLFQNKEIYMSATKIDRYNRCPFSYFCQFGLSVYPVRTAEMNAVNTGNVVHYCMEKLMSRKNEEGIEVYNEKFTKYSESEFSDLIRQFLNEYKVDELGGNFGKTRRFDFLYDSLLSMILEITLNIQKELRQSDYRPVHFEYSLTKGEHSVLEMKVDDITVKISGKIDRVDTFKKDGKSYIRIIDYKTGTKELKFEDLYNGLNLQMILYLSALTDGKSDYKGYIPAGILYMPARFLDASIERQQDRTTIEAKVEATKLSSFRMNGIVVDIEESYSAMEKELKGKLIKLKKDKSNLMPPDDFKKLTAFTENKVVEIVSKLKQGKIEAIPVGEEAFLPCDYCEYWSVCGNYNPDNAKVISRQDSECLLDELKKDKEGDSNE